MIQFGDVQRRTLPLAVVESTLDPTSFQDCRKVTFHFTDASCESILDMPALIKQRQKASTATHAH
jgi:hypothetical protein